MVFQKGQSGNPAGMKPGTKHKKLELLRSNDQKLQKKVLDMAMQGDTAALKIVADRLWPRLRSQAMPVSIDVNGDLATTGRKVIDAALSGEVTVDVLKDLLGALYLQGQITELSELEQRLAALEDSASVAPWEKSKPESNKLPLRGRKRRRDLQ